MPIQKCEDDDCGNTEEDWEIFEILCQDAPVSEKLSIKVKNKIIYRNAVNFRI